MVYKGIVYQSADGKVNEIKTYDSTFIRFTIPRIGESVRYNLGKDVKVYKVKNVIYDISNRCVVVELEDE